MGGGGMGGVYEVNSTPVNNEWIVYTAMHGPTVSLALWGAPASAQPHSPQDHLKAVK